MNSVNKTRNIFTYILSFSASFIGIVLNLFLARVLGAESYGEIQYFIAIATTFSQFLVFGLNSYLIRESKNENNKNIFDKCLTLYVVISSFFIPIMSYVSKGILELNEISTFYVLLIGFVIGINSIISSFYQGKGKYKITIVVETLAPKLGIFALSLVFYFLGKVDSLSNFFLPLYLICFTCASIPLLFKNIKKFVLNFEKGELKSIFYFFGLTITYSLGNNLTKILQGGLYNNDTALAIISVSVSIVSLVKVFTSVLDNMVKPLFAKYSREKDNEKVLDLYNFDTRMNSYIAIPLYLFFILNSSKFLLIFGDSYLEYPYILAIISAANLVTDITGPNGTLLAMTGKEKIELLNGFIYFCFYILGVFAFSFDKVYGLCFALLFGQLAVNIAKYIEVWKVYNKNPLTKKTIISLLIMLATNFVFIFPLKFVENFILWLVFGLIEGCVLTLTNCFILSLQWKKDFVRLLKLKL